MIEVFWLISLFIGLAIPLLILIIYFRKKRFRRLLQKTEILDSQLPIVESITDNSHVKYTVLKRLSELNGVNQIDVLEIVNRLGAAGISAYWEQGIANSIIGSGIPSTYVIYVDETQLKKAQDILQKG